jgi:zinc transporter ZupT
MTAYIDPSSAAWIAMASTGAKAIARSASPDTRRKPIWIRKPSARPAATKAQAWVRPAMASGIRWITAMASSRPAAKAASVGEWARVNPAAKRSPASVAMTRAAAMAAKIRVRTAGVTVSGDAERAMAFAPVLAIAIHAALDGSMYAVMFASDSLSGVAGGAGLLLHKPADAAVCFILLQRAGVSDGRAAMWSFLAAGFSTLAAAALSAPFAASLPPAMIAGLLGLVAGVLIHVSAAHLLGHARSVGGLRRAIPMVALGALAATGLTAAHHVGHDHGAHAHEAHDHDDHEGHDHALLDPAIAGPDFSPMGARTYRYASLTRASHGDPR